MNLSSNQITPCQSPRHPAHFPHFCMEGSSFYVRAAYRGGHKPLQELESAPAPRAQLPAGPWMLLRTMTINRAVGQSCYPEFWGKATLKALYHQEGLEAKLVCDVTRTEWAETGCLLFCWPLFSAQRFCIKTRTPPEWSWPTEQRPIHIVLFMQDCPFFNYQTEVYRKRPTFIQKPRMTLYHRHLLSGRTRASISPGPQHSNQERGGEPPSPLSHQREPHLEFLRVTFQSEHVVRTPKLEFLNILCEFWHFIFPSFPISFPQTVGKRAEMTGLRSEIGCRQ